MTQAQPPENPCCIWPSQSAGRSKAYIPCALTCAGSNKPAAAPDAGPLAAPEAAEPWDAAKAAERCSSISGCAAADMPARSSLKTPPQATQPGPARKHKGIMHGHSAQVQGVP